MEIHCIKFDHRSASLSGGCDVIKGILSGALSVCIIKTSVFAPKEWKNDQNMCENWLTFYCSKSN